MLTSRPVGCAARVVPGSMSRCPDPLVQARSASIFVVIDGLDRSRAPMRSTACSPQGRSSQARWASIFVQIDGLDRGRVPMSSPASLTSRPVGLHLEEYAELDVPNARRRPPRRS
jgi:hypothetical protein